MKILFVAPFGLGEKTTVWARILPLGKVVHSSNPDANQVIILIPPWDTPSDAGKSWVDGGVEIRNVSLAGGLPMIIWRLMREVHAEAPDIVHIIKPRAYAGIVQWLLWVQRILRLPFQHKQQRIAPLILLDIDDWEQAWNEMNAHGLILSRFLTWQEEWGIRHADGISAASRWLEKRSRDYAPDTPLLYLPNGVVEPTADSRVEPMPSITDAVNAEPNTTNRQKNTFKILYLTRYVEVSPDWLAAFWHHLCQQSVDLQSSPKTENGDTLPQLELIVAGGPLQDGRDSNFRVAFEEAIQRDTKQSSPPGVATRISSSSRTPLRKEQISWLGLVSSETIAQLYTECDCAIFPATPVPLQAAKCSVRLATTLLHGLPVVASAVGQQSEYGANGAAKLIPEDAGPEEFADAVYDVLVDPEKQKEISQQARSHLLEKYHWERLGQTLVQFYLESQMRPE